MKADNYNISTEEGTLTVFPSTAASLAAEGYTGKYDGQSHDGVTSVSVVNAVEGLDWTYTYSTDGETYTDEMPQFKDAGTYTVDVKATNPNYEDLYATVTVEISPREVTLTSATDSKTYDGTALTNHNVTVGGDGFVEGEGATYDVTGSQTNVDSSKNTFTYTLNEGTKAGNYTITKVEGTLTVTAAEGMIVVTANSNEKTYDGTALTDPGYTVIGEVAEGDVLTATVEGFITDAGEVPNVVTSYKVMRGDVDVTGNYDNITTADGTLTVTPAVVTVTADDQSKVVGEPLPELTYTVETEVASETPAFTGELEYVGDDTRGVHTDEITQGTLALTDGENFKASNYTLVFVPGTLAIHARGMQVEKTVDKTEAKVGSELVYTITVRNTGDMELTDVVITDPMLNMEKNIGSLAPGVVWTESFTYEVQSSDGGKTIVNTVIAKAADGTEDEAVSPGTEVTKPSTGGGVLNTKDHYSYIIGYKDGNVRPYGTVSRGEVATIFFRLLTDEARDKYWSQENNYSDCGPDLWCNNAISTLSNMGIIDGYSDGTFRPNENITRAQACVIVNRALNRTPNAERLLPESKMITWPDCTPDDWFYADMQEATNSHDYVMVTVKGEKVEKWSKKLPQRDWAAFGHAWSTAHSAPGGEVVK